MLEKYLNPNYIRTLLLDPNCAKQDCVNFARFCAAYYLDFLLFEPNDSFPSLYVWEGLKKSELDESIVIYDRALISQRLPHEYSPALPALLLVKCDNLIEAISYLDHFDDKRSALILRLLADSIHRKDLATEYIKSMIVESIPLEIDRIIQNHAIEDLPIFTTKIIESILELDVGLNRDILGFLESSLVGSAEYLFSQLPLETTYEYSNPIFGFSEQMITDEGMIFGQIWCNIFMILSSLARSNRIIQQVTFTFKLVTDEVKTPSKHPTFVLQRILLLMLRLSFRQKFSDAIKMNNKQNIPELANQYKSLLEEDIGECEIIKKWSATAPEEDMQIIEKFFDFINDNFKQSSNIPSLSKSTREIWLRRIIFNNSADHRDHREERNIDWLRSICHPSHRVNDVVLSQMLFVNSQWSPPGFSFISPGCHALRLSIHPHDLCLGSADRPDFSLSARDVLYTPISSLSLPDDAMIFTPRDDLISRYAKTARVLKPIDEKIREFAKGQDDLLKELEEEREFLSRSSNGNVMSTTSKSKLEVSHNEEASMLSRQIAILTEKLDNVVKSINEHREPATKFSYIRDDDDVESLAPLDLQYDNASAQHSDESPTIEKLNFDLLSGRDTPLETAKTWKDPVEPFLPSSSSSEENKKNKKISMENPLFNNITTTTHNQMSIPFEWMKLLPLDEKVTSARNLLEYIPPDEKTLRKIFSERAIQANDDISTKIGTTQTDQMKSEEVKKKIIGEKRMSREDINQVLQKVKNLDSL